MKRITYFLSAVVLSTVMGMSGASAGGVEKGNVIIDPYYGFPNWGKAFSDLIVDPGGDVKTTGLGPLGGRVEDMLGDKFGLGVDFIYNTYSYTYSTFGIVEDYQMSRTRVHLRFNIHFGDNENLDTYFGVGAGLNSRKLTWTYGTTDLSIGEAALLPVSMRFALGMRYYFHENIGFNVEIGLGGPTISLGPSIKF